MLEKHETLEANFEGLRQELKMANTRLEEIQQMRESEILRFKELERKMLEETAQLKAQLEEREGQVAMAAVEYDVLKSSVAQAFTRGREEGVASRFAMYRNTQEFNDEVCRRGSSFYIDGFSVCLEQFKNLGNLPPDFDFSFLNVRADAFGRMGDEGPSGG
ncbi:UNVERIFIED_CONTAM: hypothetical protein Slati_2179100 [Sesamum latifolium]|uniref:Uncharacterized protein n=1 Tax=Sesamum latifolium TaxID=2727402 RepID=A0AAW2WRX5_9LAMI